MPVYSWERQFGTSSATQWHDLCSQNAFRSGQLKF